MPKIRFGLISGFKFQSILAKTLVVLTVLIAITVGSVYLLFQGLVAERYREASRGAQQLLLTRVSVSADQLLARTQRGMDRLFADQNVTGLMISPARYDYERLTNVMDSLFALAGQDTIIRGVSLYVFGSDMVYDSRGEIGTILEHPDKALIIACLTAKGETNSFLLDGRPVGLLERDGRLLLFQTYPATRPNGLLAVELDPGRFYQETAAVRDGEEGAIHFLDQHGQPLFGAQERFSQLPQPGGNPFLSWEEGEQTAYTYRSELTGLTAATRLPTSTIMPTPRSTLAVATPYLAVMVVIIALLALYLIWTIYKPVQDVVYSMVAAGRDGPVGRGRNELDFIRNTYQDSEQKNALLSETLAQVAPAVTEKLFLSLLSESQPGEEELAAMLESIHSPFRADARYIALLLRPHGTGEEPHSLDAEIAGVWLLGFCRTYWRDRAVTHFMALPAGDFVGILAFDRDVPGSKTKLLIADFQELLARQSRDMRHSWDVGVGKLHIGIMEIRVSAQEARQALGRALYFRQEDGAGTGQAADTAYFTGRMRQLAGFAADGRLDDALAGLSILDEIDAQCGQDPARAVRIGRDILNTLAEEMVRRHIDLAALPPEPLRGDMPPPDWLGELAAFCRQGLSLLQAAGLRGRNKHVDTALKYIADNYASTTLSLDEVSAHVGITSSYLSRIFADTVGCGFLDHLNQYRIDKARQLLAATDLQISEVGYQAGFSSSQSFTRVFKKLMGCTPSAYRETVRGLAGKP